jgi:3-oxoacyl-[acyl-carrier-protein] synthase-3
MMESVKKGFCRARIISTGSYVPEEIVTNQDFEKILDTSDEWIRTRTGISERRRAAKHQASSDLAVEASRRAIAKANIQPEEIDLIICGTITPDRMLPSTACYIQRALKAVNAWAFDLVAACSGFIYGLAVGAQFIETGRYKTVLMVSTEILSRVVDYTDRGTCVLFGDGAGAAILRTSEDHRGLLSFDLGADGNGADLLDISGGVSRINVDTEIQDHYIRMQGNEIFKFAVRAMAESTEKSLNLAGLTKNDLDFLVPHQANLRIIQSTLKRLELPMEKSYVNIHRYGNMSGATVAIALDEALEQQLIHPGDCVGMVAFGGGLTWGSCVMYM